MQWWTKGKKRGIPSQGRRDLFPPNFPTSNCEILGVRGGAGAKRRESRALRSGWRRKKGRREERGGHAADSNAPLSCQAGWCGRLAANTCGTAAPHPIRAALAAAANVAGLPRRMHRHGRVSLPPLGMLARPNRLPDTNIVWCQLLM